MNKVWAFLLILSLLVVSACGGSAPTAKQEPAPAGAGSEGKTAKPSESLKPVTLKLGHVGADKSAQHIASKFFAERVRELTDGKVTIEIYPGGQLGGERDITESIANGSLSMGAPGFPLLANFTPAFLGFGMPFIIKNKEVEYQLYKSDFVSGEVFKELEKLNIKVLGIIPTGFFQFGTTSKPIRNMEDLKGIKIRSTENTMMVDAYSALGLNPTPMPYPEMYNALQTGVIEGGALQTYSWITEGFSDVVNYVSMVNALPYAAALLLNLEEFNSFPQEYQNAIVQAGNETTDYMIEFINDYSNSFLQQLKDAGITVIEDFDRTGVDEALQPVMDKYAAQDPFVKRTFELVQELNSKN